MSSLSAEVGVEDPASNTVASWLSEIARSCDSTTPDCGGVSARVACDPGRCAPKVSGESAASDFSNEARTAAAVIAAPFARPFLFRIRRAPVRDTHCPVSLLSRVGPGKIVLVESDQFNQNNCA